MWVSYKFGESHVNFNQPKRLCLDMATRLVGAGLNIPDPAPFHGTQPRPRGDRIETLPPDLPQRGRVSRPRPTLTRENSIFYKIF